MKKNELIKIKGEDIIGWDGDDRSGALKELGIDFKYDSNDLINFQKMCEMEFMVNLDFILRHGLLDARIYENYYKNSEEYKKYYNFGKLSFHNRKDSHEHVNNPYDCPLIDKDVYHKRYPWFDGYREAEAKFYKNKYKINQFHKEIQEIVKKYGLKLKYTDEYKSPYLETPEGFNIQFA